VPRFIGLSFTELEAARGRLLPIAPLAAGDAALYLALSMMLALLVGLLCIAASFLRLGAIADFLSKPILVGFMNGLSISIVLSQFGLLFGIPMASSGFFPRALEFVRSLSSTHLPTLAIGIASLAVRVASGRYLRKVPAALLAMLVAGFPAWVFSLEEAGVSTIGKVPAGLPMLSLQRVPLYHLPILLAEAAGLALVVAAVLVPVLLFLIGPLQFVPTVAFAAILITTGFSLINWDDLRAIHRIDPQEFWLAMIATVGVLTGIRFFPTLRLAEIKYRAETQA
jgi:MFS superfamily sulfate permease-like transporter